MSSASLRLLAPVAALTLACGGSSGARSSFTLSVTVGAGGSVTGSPVETSCASGSCATSQPQGTLVVLTPLSAPGFTFTGWTGDCQGSGLCTPALSADRSVTASFASTTPAGPANVLPLTVNGETCGSGAGSYANKPCVRVTVCVPGTTTCATVDDVLVDTGSYGLRLFKEVLPFTLPQVPALGGGTLTECIAYLDGSSQWGPVATAEVRLGGEPAVQVPIQVIDGHFAAVPSSCKKPELGPTYFNGILGVGLFAEDCGGGCTSAGGGGVYFACTGTRCLGTAVQVVDQVPNPVTRLPVDNNGVIVDLPAVPLGGAPSVSGNLILGIDTQANNGSAGATFLGTNSQGLLRTTYDSKTLGGFLDSGSNGLFFPAPSNGALPACASPNGGWFCPATLTAVTIPFTNSSSPSGAPSLAANLQIGNALRLFASNGSVFKELGGTLTTNFDFGLPFFLGQKVYVVMDGSSVSAISPPLPGRYFGY